MSRRLGIVGGNLLLFEGGPLRWSAVSGRAFLHEAPSGPKFAVLRLALAKAPIRMAVFNLVKRCGRPSGGKDGRGEPGLGGGTTTRTQNTL
jgi:hypothetical protein